MIETHNRITNPYQSKSTKELHLRAEFRNLENNKPLLDKARKIGPNVEELVKTIVIQGRGFIDTRKIWGILSLDKKYDHGRIDVACKNALETNELSYQYVLRFLNLKLAPENKIENYAQDSKPIYGRDIAEYKKRIIKQENKMNVEVLGQQLQQLKLRTAASELLTVLEFNHHDY
jgi:hypothetical protein